MRRRLARAIGLVVGATLLPLVVHVGSMPAAYAVPQAVGQPSPVALLPGDVADLAVSLIDTDGSWSLDVALSGPFTPEQVEAAPACETLTPLFSERRTGFGDAELSLTAPPGLSATGYYLWDVWLRDGVGGTVSRDCTAATQVLAPVTLTTQASARRVGPWDFFHDTIWVTGTEGRSFTLNWALLGPLDPVDGLCDGLDWSAAGTHESGSLSVVGDGEYRTPAIQEAIPALPRTATEGEPDTTVVRCYTFVVTGDGDGVLVVPTEPGDPAQTVSIVTSLVTSGPPPTRPVIRTEVSDRTVHKGARVYDNISLTHMPWDQTLTLKWRLLGPVRPRQGDCRKVRWGGAPVVARGIYKVSGDLVLATPLVKLKKTGCYTYAEVIPATDWSPRVVHRPGKVSQTVRVFPRHRVVIDTGPDGWL